MPNEQTRRDFIKTASAGATALGLSALSAGKVHGANDRIRIGIIGCGQRGVGAHMRQINAFADDENVEIVAVADPWRQKREQAADIAKSKYGRAPEQFVSYRDLLDVEDLDAVTIASCDHQHTTHLKAVAEAKKDVYCEKPLAMDFEKLKAACDAVTENDVICQIGTQLRSYASFTGCRDVYQTGVLGNVARIEQRRNGSKPYWYSRVTEVNEEDVDWDEFLMDAPKRPFDPVRYSGWYGYMDYSPGPVPGLGSHFIDLVHYITGAKYPTSATCLGGIFTWKDEHNFTCPDHVQAEWIYPEGFMVSYATNFGNGSGNSFRIYGDKGVMDMADWNHPKLSGEGVVRGTEDAAPDKDIEPIERPDHFHNWLQCLRSRETPHAPIDAGYQHAVATILATTAYETGKRQVYDAETREIREG